MIALSTLSQDHKQHVIPVIEIVDDGEVGAISSELNDVLTGMPFYLDTSYADDGVSLLMGLIRDSRNRGLESFPVISFEDLNELSDEILELAKRILLRVPVPEDIDGESYEEIFTEVKTWSSDRDVIVDVMLDLGYMANKSVANSRFVELKTVLLSHFLHDHTFGSIIIASTSCPTDLATLAAGENILIDRFEFKIFNKIYNYAEFNSLKSKFLLSDYGVTRFTDSEIDFTKMRYGILPKARYTLDDKYWIIKGQKDRATRRTIKGHKQIAEEIFNSPRYYGETYSFGDNEIKSIATTNRGPGNNTNWVTITASHHMAVAIGQLSSFV